MRKMVIHVRVWATAMTIAALFSSVMTSCGDDEEPVVVDVCQSQPITLAVKAEAYAIVATATGGNGTLQYSLDGTTFQTSGTFDVDEVKAYTLTVKDAEGCTATANISAEALTSFTDTRDNKTYKVVKIGNQIWMAENFNYATEGGVCYDNEPANCDEYGKLYTVDAAIENAPQGWHLPAYEEWQTLVEYLGGDAVAGTELKTTGTSGFNGKYGGYWDAMAITDNKFFSKGQLTSIWSSTPADIEKTKYYFITFGKDFEGNELSEVSFTSGRLKDELKLSVRYLKSK